MMIEKNITLNLTMEQFAYLCLLISMDGNRIHALVEGDYQDEQWQIRHSIRLQLLEIDRELSNGINGA